ncbi:hypothetical protein VTN00DRAFT_2043 [Thermoascus crustaceus]|uniref:uncharacterized protein n=1 Tax=Thermoascus crustaceus TaxID=5088 RepID=UPI00374243D7
MGQAGEESSTPYRQELGCAVGDPLLIGVPGRGHAQPRHLVGPRRPRAISGERQAWLVSTAENASSHGQQGVCASWSCLLSCLTPPGSPAAHTPLALLTRTVSPAACLAPPLQQLLSTHPSRAALCPWAAALLGPGRAPFLFICPIPPPPLFPLPLPSHASSPRLSLASSIEFSIRPERLVLSTTFIRKSLLSLSLKALLSFERRLSPKIHHLSDLSLQSVLRARHLLSVLSFLYRNSFVKRATGLLVRSIVPSALDRSRIYIIQEVFDRSPASPLIGIHDLTSSSRSGQYR